MGWTARHARIEDLPYLAQNLREVDKQEIYYSSGRTPEEALKTAFDHDTAGIWVGLLDKQPEIIFGLHYTANPNIGSPWMVCTDRLYDMPLDFAKKSRLWADGFKRQFPLLVNFVYAENDLHIRWLKWCGAEFVKLHPEYGHAKKPFWEFHMKHEDK